MAKSVRMRSASFLPFHPDQLAVPFSLIEAFGVGAAAALDRSAGVGIYYASPASSIPHFPMGAHCTGGITHSLNRDRGCVECFLADVLLDAALHYTAPLTL